MQNLRINKCTVYIAIVLLLLGNLFATGADIFVKAFGESSGIYQYLFLRQLLLLIFLAPAFFTLPRMQRRPLNFKVQFFRANLTVIGGACTVIALSHLTLATANVIFYTGPVITLLLAAWWFKEKLYTYRLINITCCFLGVLIALQPDSASIGIAAALMAAFVVACHNLLVRYIPKQVPSMVILFWGTLLSIPVLGMLSISHWHPLNRDMLYLIVGSALCVGSYQWCCVIAYRTTEAGAIAVAEYAGLIFAAIFGWLLFAEDISVLTAFGIILIILPIAFQSRIEVHKTIKKA